MDKFFQGMTDHDTAWWWSAVIVGLCVFSCWVAYKIKCFYQKYKKRDEDDYYRDKDLMMRK